MEGRHAFPSRDVLVFSGFTKTMRTYLLASLKLLLPKQRCWTGKCVTWNPRVILPGLPLPSLPSAMCSHSLSPLARQELLPDSLGRQASPAPPTRDAAWMQIKPWSGCSGQDTRLPTNLCPTRSLPPSSFPRVAIFTTIVFFKRRS